jgi:hypothetical protein
MRQEAMRAGTLQNAAMIHDFVSSGLALKDAIETKKNQWELLSQRMGSLMCEMKSRDVCRS